MTDTHSVRAARLRAYSDELASEYGVEPNYIHVEPGDRFLGVMAAVIDGESGAIRSYPSAAAASVGMAEIDFDYPREPVLLLDVQTGRRYVPELQTRVRFKQQV